MSSPKAFRFSYVIRGKRVKKGGTPEGFSVAGCTFGFWGVDRKRQEEIKREVKEMFETYVQEKGYRTWEEEKGDEYEEGTEAPTEVSWDETHGLGPYRGYAQVELNETVTQRFKGDLRFRHTVWFPTTKEFACPTDI